MISTPKLSEPSQVSAKSVAPTLAGLAVGLFVGARIRGRDRDATAIALAGTALIAGIPLIVEWIRRDYYVDPASKRGAQRHLEGIRRGEFVTDDEDVYDDDLAERYRA